MCGFVEANFYRVAFDASRRHPEHESKLSIKKEPVRRGPKAEAPRTTLRRSNIDYAASVVPENELASAVSEDAPELSDARFIKVIRELLGNLARRLFPS
uniref:Uncharacterized protein n=1 Tax=Tanacetum cinerariifolium TaxID=118510 RepID=A0A699ITF5_TANCI|nr:hypothetical protein [Tanacetum cinerariifolium]